MATGDLFIFYQSVMPMKLNRGRNLFSLHRQHFSTLRDLFLLFVTSLSFSEMSHRYDNQHVQIISNIHTLI